MEAYGRADEAWLTEPLHTLPLSPAIPAGWRSSCLVPYSSKRVSTVLGSRGRGEAPKDGLNLRSGSFQKGLLAQEKKVTLAMGFGSSEPFSREAITEGSGFYRQG